MSSISVGATRAKSRTRQAYDRIIGKLKAEREESRKAEELKKLEEKNKVENQKTSSIEEDVLDWESCHVDMQAARTQAAETAAALLKHNIPCGKDFEGGQGEREGDGKKRKYNDN